MCMSLWRYFGSQQGALSRKGDEFSGTTQLLMFIYHSKEWSVLTFKIVPKCRSRRQKEVCHSWGQHEKRAWRWQERCVTDPGNLANGDCEWLRWLCLCSENSEEWKNVSMRVLSGSSCQSLYLKPRIPKCLLLLMSTENGSSGHICRKFQACVENQEYLGNPIFPPEEQKENVPWRVLAWGG